MALADKLEEANKKTINTQTYCAYVLMYQSLSEADQKALDAAWEKGYSGRVILRALRAENIKTSNEAISAHRNKICKCLN